MMGHLNDLDGITTVRLVLSVVGAWTVARWSVRALRNLLRSVTRGPHGPHRPRLSAGECSCPRYDSWTDCYVEHRSGCRSVAHRAQVEQ
jgi:hypothetical protein